MKIKVIRRKLGKEKADGLAWQADNKIEIDPRLSPQDELDTLVHEVSHCVFPDLSEKQIIRLSTAITKTLWKEGFRKCRL